MKIMKSLCVLAAMGFFLSLCSISVPATANAAVAAPAKAKAKAAKKASKPVKGKQHGIPRVAPAGAPAPVKTGP